MEVKWIQEMIGSSINGTILQNKQTKSTPQIPADCYGSNRQCNPTYGEKFCYPSETAFKVSDLSKIEYRKIACFSLDVEQDYGTLLQIPQYEGLNNIPKMVSLFKDLNLPLTCFVQGSLFETHPEEVACFFELDIELEPHSYSHPGPEIMNFCYEIEKSSSVYKEYTGNTPLGYRSPDGYVSHEEYYETLHKNNIKYDSSIFPSFRPERFNHLKYPTRPYYVLEGKILEIPFSVLSPVLRIPISLSYLKLFGPYFLKLIRHFPLPNLIIFDFHLHDLTKLPSVDHIFKQNSLSKNYSRILKKTYYNNGDLGFYFLKKFIEILNIKGYEFSKLKDVYRGLNS